MHLYCWNEMEIANLIERAGFRTVRSFRWSVRLKWLLRGRSFRTAYFLGRIAGRLLRALRIRPGVDELVIHAERVDAVAAGTQVAG
jgi:hypothetical protein